MLEVLTRSFIKMGRKEEKKEKEEEGVINKRDEQFDRLI